MEGRYWVSDNGIKDLERLGIASSEEDYQTTVLEIAERTKKSVEAIVLAFRRRFGHLPPGKPSKAPTLTDYLNAHPEEYVEPTVDPALATSGLSLLITYRGWEVRVKR